MQDFVILGLANCFVRNDENQLEEIKVIEPIPSAAFLSLLQGGPSSYSQLRAFECQDVMAAIGINSSSLGFEKDVQFASDFEERLEASVRTYKHNPSAASKLPIGEVLELGNHSSQKRILNQIRTVKTTDNVKQHSHAMKTL